MLFPVRSISKDHQPDLDESVVVADGRVRFLAATSTGSAFGIYSSFARRDIRDNSIVGNGSVGIHCHTTT